MSILIDAIYEKGILRPLQPLNLKENDRVKIAIDLEDQWEKAFESLLNSIHKRTGKYSSEEIEADITQASLEVKESRCARQSTD